MKNKDLIWFCCSKDARSDQDVADSLRQKSAIGWLRATAVPTTLRNQHSNVGALLYKKIKILLFVQFKTDFSRIDDLTYIHERQYAIYFHE